MKYKFPKIRNISDILPAIAGRDEFVVAERDGYTIINYNVMMADTFPPVLTGRETISGIKIQNFNAAIRRECRGITFDSKTGNILRRPFHKFFNVNEREETQDHLIDLSQDHVVLEKLDGSMIAPFIVKGNIIWGTKMAAQEFHETVSNFVADKPEYEEFVRLCIANGVTPIFEWCSRKNRIVIDYPEDQLILTGMRDMINGGYYVHSAIKALAYKNEKVSIPVVKAFNAVDNMKQFVDYVSGIEDVEGFVLRFNDGHMAKIKCHWYLQIHKAKEAILQDRNIVSLILEEHLDDIKAHLPAEDRDRLTMFESKFNMAISNVAYSIFVEIVDISEKNIDRKTFALTRAKELDSYTRPIIFSLWDVDPIIRAEIEKEVRNTIRNNLSRNHKYEAIRDTWFPNVKFN